MRIFQNQHRHSTYSNPRVSDSVVMNEDYAIRAKELGHGIISTMEHGWQGRYIEGYELAKKYDLKFVFGAEAYWVKNRFEPDGTNSHICIYAKNENGRQCINEILSEANISGFYKQPRIDLDLIYSLPADDVIIVTACVAFWKYDDIDEIVKGLHSYFRNNLYLECQYHNTDSQKLLNSRIVKLAEKLGIGLMMGCDSHYIDDSTSWERTDYLASKGVVYGDEDGWFLDYPDGDTAYQRFIEQGVLTDEQIEECFSNTNIFLQVEEYDNPCFTYDIKMPSLYPELSQEEKNQKYENLIWEKWNEEKGKINPEKWSHYESEIAKEIDTVKITNHADYFMMDYELIKESVKKGGMITNTGRGSAVSFYTNKLLGLTKVDRIASKVHMYPERFMSATRILEAKTLADIDMNLGNPEVFALTQKELFGEECAYPMIAYGKYQVSSAFKMYAKAKDVPYEIANEISKQIKQYETELKYAEEEDKDEIHLEDYIDEKYHQILEDSEKYLGIISSWSQHPCAYLIYQGDIRREIGLVMMRANQGKKLTLCCLMDGLWAENHKFLKNDLLKVNVVRTIKETYKDIGIPEHDTNELLEICEYNQKVNDIYKYGWTIGINQLEQKGSKAKMMKYQSKNITELTAFIAAIRPSFKSMFKTFQNREHFDYGIKAFDDIIQTEEMKSSFILYQEMIMAALNFAGIPMTECYEVIKCISKKRKEKIYKYEKIFKPNFAKKIIEIQDSTLEEAEEASNKIWQIIYDSAAYGFNASHAYCVALDSLYGAYLKAYYPIHFYKVFMNILNEKGDKDRMVLTSNEMKEAFGISLLPLRFRQDNRSFSIDKENNALTNTIKSIKGIGGGLAESLYELKDCDYPNFVTLLIDLIDKGIMCKHILSLIEINYFEEYGGNKKLISIYNEVMEGKNRYSKKHTEKTKLKRIPLLIEFEKNAPDEKLSIFEQIKSEIKIFGEPKTISKELSRMVFIKEVDTQYSPKLDVIAMANGKTLRVKMKKPLYNKNPIEAGEVIKIIRYEDKLDGRYENGKYREIPNTKVWWITEYVKVEVNKC